MMVLLPAMFIHSRRHHRTSSETRTRRPRPLHRLTPAEGRAHPHERHYFGDESQLGGSFAGSFEVVGSRLHARAIEAIARELREQSHDGRLAPYWDWTIAFNPPVTRSMRREAKSTASPPVHARLKGMRSAGSVFAPARVVNRVAQERLAVHELAAEPFEDAAKRGRVPGRPSTSFVRPATAQQVGPRRLAKGSHGRTGLTAICPLIERAWAKLRGKW